MDGVSPGERAEWVQPKTFENRFELRSEGASVAFLEFRSAWGTLASAEMADGSFTFKRLGFLRPRVTVRAPGSDENLGLYEPRFGGGGDLRLRDGRSFSFRPTSFWQTRWAFADSAGMSILEFRSGVEDGGLSDLLKTQFTVEFSAPRAGPVAILATLGMYLIVLQQRDSAGAGAATAC